MLGRLSRFRFQIARVRTARAALAAAFLLSAPVSAQNFNVSNVRIAGVNGSVNIVLTSRPGIRITSKTPSGGPLINSSIVGDAVVIQTEIDDASEEAASPPSGSRAGIEISMPTTAALTIENSDIDLRLGDFKGQLTIIRSRIVGEVNGADRASIELLGGSSLAVGAVRTETDIQLVGDADLRIESANLVRATVNEVTGLTIGKVELLFDLSVGGKAAVSADKVSGALYVNIKDRGMVSIADGRINRMQATLDGPGSLAFGGVTGDAELKLVSDATIVLGHVTGSVVLIGDGAVYIDGRRQYAWRTR